MRSLSNKLARVIVLTEYVQDYKDRERAGHFVSSTHTELFNEAGSQLTKLMHDHDVIAAIADARKVHNA